MKRRMFGRSSEKSAPEDVSPDQGWLFNEAEVLSTISAPETLSIAAHERKRGGRKRLAADLPRVDVIHDLAESEKVCERDATALERIGEETSEQLDYQPAKVRVIRHVRPSTPARVVGKASSSPQCRCKSLASPALLAHIVTAKYVDGLPLHRQEAQWQRLGVNTVEQFEALLPWNIVDRAQPKAIDSSHGSRAINSLHKATSSGHSRRPNQ